MGDKSQPAFLKKALDDTGFSHSKSPRLALNTGSISSNFGADYSFLEHWGVKLEGCDLKAGENVDHVFDLTDHPPDLLINKYDIIISSSTLEHVSKPWLAANCLKKLLRPAGYLYVSVPWVWRYHAYPNDYWRFNRHTLDILFPDTTVIRQAWSTSPDCRLYTFSDSFDDENSIIVNNSSPKSRMQRMLNFFRPPLQENLSSKKYLPYLMIHQLRQKDE
jgi:SAM-dependent methyltransferase